MPCFLARSRATASCLLLMTATIRAGTSPRSIASITACRLEPLPEANTATRSRDEELVGILNVRFTCCAGHHFPDQRGLLAHRHKPRHHGVGGTR